MISRRAPCFTGLQAYYVDEYGAPLFNDHGTLVTDEDVDSIFDCPELSSLVDALNMEIFALRRARGEPLTERELDGELAAFLRAQKRGA